MTVRAAVLILEHRQPQRLAALIRSLDHPDIDVYVHIDGAVPRQPFEAAAPPGPQVIYLGDTQRVPVTWGGPSLVDAIVATVQTAHDSGRGYHRYALLSGADLRIASLDTILEAWSTPAEFLRLDRALTGADLQPNWRVRRRHFRENRDPIRRALSGRIPRSVDRTVDLYQGSQWWALTDGAVRHLCHFLDRHPDWLRFHRHTFGPDEIVVQSIIANSPFAQSITQNYTRSAVPMHDRLHGMHYIDWSDPAASSPRVLSTDDLEDLRRSPALFARKVDRASADLVGTFEREFAGR